MSTKHGARARLGLVVMRTHGFRRWLLVALAAAMSGTTGQAQTPVAVSWAVFVDDLHLDFRNTGRLRDLLRTVGSELIHNGDTFMLTTAGPSGVTVPMTADRAAFTSAVRRVAGNALKPADMLSLPTSPQMVSEVQSRVGVALDAARQTLAQLISHRADSGQAKALVYVTNGYYLDLDEPIGARRPPPAGRPPRDRVALPHSSLARLRGERSALLGAAQRAGVKIVVIDARIVDPLELHLVMDPAAWQRYQTLTRQSVAPLAHASGGVALLNRDDLTDGWARINRLVGRGF